MNADELKYLRNCIRYYKVKLLVKLSVKTPKEAGIKDYPCKYTTPGIIERKKAFSS